MKDFSDIGYRLIRWYEDFYVVSWFLSPDQWWKSTRFEQATLKV